MRHKIGKAALYAAEFVFVAVAFVFISWMQALADGGIEVVFSFDALSNWWNWMIILGQTMLCIFIMTIIINHGYDEKVNRPSSRLCKALKTNELRVNQIYSGNLKDELSDAVKKYNDNCKKECYLRHAKRLNSYIEQEDLDTILKDSAKIDEFKKDFCYAGMSEKQIKRAFFKRLYVNHVIDKLVNGKYKDYEKISDKQLLDRGVFDKKEEDGLTNKQSQVKTNKIARGAIMSFLFAAGLLIIITDMIINFSIVSTLSNFIYLASAAFKGFWSMVYYCNYSERLFERRNGFFATELKLTDRWQLQELEKNGNYIIDSNDLK